MPSARSLPCEFCFHFSGPWNASQTRPTGCLIFLLRAPGLRKSPFIGSWFKQWAPAPGGSLAPVFLLPTSPNDDPTRPLPHPLPPRLRPCSNFRPLPRRRRSAWIGGEWQSHRGQPQQVIPEITHPNQFSKQPYETETKPTNKRKPTKNKFLPVI